MGSLPAVDPAKSRGSPVVLLTSCFPSPLASGLETDSKEQGEMEAESQPLAPLPSPTAPTCLHSSELGVRL